MMPTETEMASLTMVEEEVARMMGALQVKGFTLDGRTPLLAAAQVHFLRTQEGANGEADTSNSSWDALEDQDCQENDLLNATQNDINQSADSLPHLETTSVQQIIFGARHDAHNDLKKLDLNSSTHSAIEPEACKKEEVCLDCGVLFSGANKEWLCEACSFYLDLMNAKRYDGVSQSVYEQYGRDADAILNAAPEPNLNLSTATAIEIDENELLNSSTMTALEPANILNESTATAVEADEADLLNTSTATALEPEENNDILDVSTATAIEADEADLLNTSTATALEAEENNDILNVSTATAIEDEADIMDTSTATALEPEDSVQASPTMVSRWMQQLNNCENHANTLKNMLEEMKSNWF